MDTDNRERSALVRTVVAGALVLFLLQWVSGTEWVSWMSRPAVKLVLILFGGEVSSDGSLLVVGKLRVPWSRDCAGFDVLIVLWGLILWTRRTESKWLSTLVVMIWAIPAALVANIARVLTIVAWRKVMFPAVESPQMHYFIGFIWLIPILGFFIPIRKGHILSVVVETVMAAAVLSLIAPQSGGPGGTLAILCALLLLGTQHWRDLRQTRMGWLLVGLWIAGGAVIAISSMESLWLAWLLMCPWFAPGVRFLIPACFVAAGTVPPLVMNAWWLPLIGILWGGWVAIRHPEEIAKPQFFPQRIGLVGSVVLLFLMPLPFVASAVGPAFYSVPSPPAGVMAFPLEPGVYVLRFSGQSPALTVTWHSPNGTGRHHTLNVCMKYRGVALKSEKSSEKNELILENDGERWMSEKFYLPEKGLYNYPEYLRKTMMPFSSPGIHLIASAPMTEMSESDFAREARQSFDRIAFLAQ